MTAKPRENPEYQSRYGWEIADEVQRFATNSANIEFIPKSAYDALAAELERLKVQYAERGMAMQDAGDIVRSLYHPEQKVLRDFSEKYGQKFVAVIQLINFLEARVRELEADCKQLESEIVNLKFRLAECKKKSEWLEGAMQEQRRCHNIEYQRAEDLNRKLAAAEAKLTRTIQADAAYLLAAIEERAEPLQWCERLANACRNGIGYEPLPNTLEPRIFSERLAEFEAWKKEKGL